MNATYLFSMRRPAKCRSRGVSCRRCLIDMGPPTSAVIKARTAPATVRRVVRTASQKTAMNALLLEFLFQKGDIVYNV